MRRALAVLAAAGLALSPATRGQAKSDWERELEKRSWSEAEVRLPGYPRPEDLIEFSFSAASTFKFFIDRTSLSVGPDGVVRYTLLARSPSGVDNVSYEGIRCAVAEYKVYATGHRDGSWSRRESGWRPIEPKGVQRWHLALRRQFFCPQDVAIRDAEEGIDALKRGRHPYAGNTSFD